MKIRYLLLLLCISCWACQGTKKVSAKKQESFDVFYQRFHRDSLFQIERVRFPLNGYAIEGGRVSSWSKAEWVMHKNGLEAIDTAIYQTERFTQHEVLQERIYQADSGVLIERHFSLLQNQWFLTFYLYVFL